jgi:hypothetical protein
MNIKLISKLLEEVENNNEIDRSKIIDLNINCLHYCNNKDIVKSDRLKLKNIIDFCFSVLLLHDSNKINSEEIVKIIKTKALYLKLDFLFDVKEDPSGFYDMIKKIEN